MELTCLKRTSGKTNAKQIRREGNIPAILYSCGNQGKEIIVEGIPFQKLLSSIEKGTLSSKILTLKVDGKPVRAVVKDIQYHVTTYGILHLDFVELHDDLLVTLNVPIILENAMDCAGVKLGGAIRRVIRHVKVRCLPKHIPSHFSLDVRALNIGQSLRLSDIVMPKNVVPMLDLKEIAVVITKR